MMLTLQVWRRSRLCLAIASLIPGSLLAGLQLAPLFRDGAVLQADAPAPVWGWAEPGDEVKVTFLDHTVSAHAGPDGRWSARLAPFVANRRGTLTAASAHGTVTVHDLVTGDVWLCAGQSNMQMPVRLAHPPVGAGATPPAGDLRVFKVGIQLSPAPREDAAGNWSRWSPESAGDFSAVAYYFGRALQARINRPVGLIVTAKGGTPIESWLSPELLQSRPAAREILQRWAEKQSRAPVSFPDPARPPFEEVEFRMSMFGTGGYAQPGVVFNGMLNPLVPYAVRGVIWYQGETNTAMNVIPQAEYGGWFRELIADWRARWGRELPFYFVQLPANDIPSRDATGETWATIREGQASALSLPATAMVVTIDLGDPGHIHPLVKQPVGERLARIALRQTYHLADPYASSPVLAAFETQPDFIRLNFYPADAPLRTRDNLPVAGLEFEAGDAHWQPLSARIEGSTLVCALAPTATIKAVRYAWAQNPAGANLCNADGLPVAPFRIRLKP